MNDNDRTYTLSQLVGRPQRAWVVVLATVGLIAIAVGTLLPILNVNVSPAVAGTWWRGKLKKVENLEMSTVKLGIWQEN